MLLHFDLSLHLPSSQLSILGQHTEYICWLVVLGQYFWLANLIVAHLLFWVLRNHCLETTAWLWACCLGCCLLAVRMLCHIAISKGNLLGTLCKLPLFATLENVKRFLIIHVNFSVEVTVRTLFSPLISLLMKKGREYNPMHGSLP